MLHQLDPSSQNQERDESYTHALPVRWRTMNPLNRGMMASKARNPPQSLKPSCTHARTHAHTGAAGMYVHQVHTQHTEGANIFELQRKGGVEGRATHRIEDEFAYLYVLRDALSLVCLLETRLSTWVPIAILSINRSARL